MRCSTHPLHSLSPTPHPSGIYRGTFARGGDDGWGSHFPRFKIYYITKRQKSRGGGGDIPDSPLCIRPCPFSFLLRLPTNILTPYPHTKYSHSLILTRFLAPFPAVLLPQALSPAPLPLKTHCPLTPQEQHDPVFTAPARQRAVLHVRGSRPPGGISVPLAKDMRPHIQLLEA